MNNRQQKLFLYCGILMLTSEIWKQWCLTFFLGNGHYNWWYFPFQLCSIPMYVCLLIGLLPDNFHSRLRAPLLTFLMDYGLLAGIFTFFDTSGLHHTYFPLEFHSYMWHILLIILGLFAGHSRAADYTNSGYKKSTGIFLACALIATLCNIVFSPFGKINMFYISPYFPMTQKVFRQIAGLLGNPIGIFIYMLSIMLGAWLIHHLWKILKSS